MSLSLGAILGIGAGIAGAQSAGNLSNDFIGGWASSSAKQSLNKAITKTNLKIQKSYDLWTQEQDKLYEKWWQNYLYDLQNNEYYDLARKYATNTASWAVQGLKKAGLNPILAGIDSNLSSSMGSAGPMSSGHGSSKGSIPHSGVSGYSGSPVNFAGALQSASAANVAAQEAEKLEMANKATRETLPASIDARISEADMARVGVQNARLQGEQITANTAESMARANLIEAQARKTSIDAVNAAKSSGFSGAAGTLFRIGAELDDVFTDKYKFLRDSVYRQYGLDADGKHSAQSGNVPVIHAVKEGDYPYYYPEYRNFSRPQYEAYGFDRDTSRARHFNRSKVSHVKPLPPPPKKR